MREKWGGYKFDQVYVFLAFSDSRAKLVSLDLLFIYYGGYQTEKSTFLTTKMANIEKVPLCSSVPGCPLYSVPLEVHRRYQPKFPASRGLPKLLLLVSEPIAFSSKMSHFEHCAMGAIVGVG